MIPKQHKYGFPNRYVQFVSYFSIAICIAAGIFFLIVGILSADVAKNDSTVFIRALLYFTFYVVLAPVALMFVIYRFSDIVVDDQCLSIKFLNKDYAVKWADILEVKPITPFGLFTRHNVIIVVTDGKLTYLHRIYGLVYGRTTRPSLLIGKSISSYSDLMKIISVRTKKMSKGENVAY